MLISYVNVIIVLVYMMQFSANSPKSPRNESTRGTCVLNVYPCTICLFVRLIYNMLVTTSIGFMRPNGGPGADLDWIFETSSAYSCILRHRGHVLTTRGKWVLWVVVIFSCDAQTRMYPVSVQCLGIWRYKRKHRL